MLNADGVEMDVCLLGFSCCDLYLELSSLLLCCRCEDLECIYNQLKTKKVRNMAELLDRVQSSYFPAFKAMFRDVLEGETWAPSLP